MIINNGQLIKSPAAPNSKGGTELLAERLFADIDPKLMDNFQIIFSRAELSDLDPTKIRILYLHDLPNDPASEKLLKNNGHEKFHKIIFVSNWQMQAYLNYYQIPWSKCDVLLNSITPIEDHEKPDPKERLNIIYTPTPHRGLDILVPVFEKLTEKWDNIHLDVYSSFKLYGWDDRDKQHEKTFEKLKSLPAATYHGSVPNDEVREAIKQSHIFAYPSIWMETSCMCLMEAMSGGLVCVHPNFGALYETGANYTFMYQWQESLHQHANLFYTCMDSAIENVMKSSDDMKLHLTMQKVYTQLFYNWNSRKEHWHQLLTVLNNSIKDRGFPEARFIYKV
jgi:glycosyltransferase involved in cell wall biosynthesis